MGTEKSNMSFDLSPINVLPKRTATVELAYMIIFIIFIEEKIGLGPQLMQSIYLFMILYFAM